MSGEDIEGRWALVTGASSGLGVDFARELAARKMNLVLVARRRERLDEVAEELREAYSVEVDVVVQDLGRRGAARELHDAVASRGREIAVLINNAGFGLHGEFLDHPWEKIEGMLELDIVTLTHLTRLYGEEMKGRGFGRILQVASIGAFQPSPTYAAYAAAKSYVLNFSEALNWELRGTGVSCTTVSPGVTSTEFLEVAGQKPTLYQRLFMMESPAVARVGIRAMLRGRQSVIPGFFNALNAWFERFMPRRMVVALAAATMK